MQRRKRRAAFVGIAALVLALAAVSAVVVARQTARSNEAVEGEAPGALGRHLEALREAVPGNEGMPEEGPLGAEAAAYEQRAYPDGEISLAEMSGAQAAFESKRGKFAGGKGRPGTWVTVGPSTALYPFTPFRDSFSYVPNSYVAASRITSVAISDTCKPGDCRIYATPAGGGVWRTKNALDGQPNWEYLGGPFGINASGSITIDQNDASGNTIYAGTGEGVCGSGCVAGTGLYRSTNGGESWTELGKAELGGKGIPSVAIVPGSPNTIYAATTTALRGMSSACCSGVTRPVPGAAKWGLYKSTDGGTSWTFIHNGAVTAAECTGSIDEYSNRGTCSPRGVKQIALDPSSPDTVYAASYARGTWRSSDGGATWTQIKESLNATVITTRPAFALAKLAGGATRMYLYEGNIGRPYARLFRSDSVATGAPVFTDLTSPSTASPGFGTYNLCGGQCWYDLFVHSPKGHPDMVYVGGSYSYGQTIANKRGVVLSTDAGVSATDMTFDGTDALHPNGLHPDQQFLVTNPNNPFQFFESNDGGLMRSSGELVNRSSWCDDPNRGLAGTDLERCRQMLSRIPSELESMNKGLTTLQFISLSVSPHNPQLLQGGTQDNGTWESGGNPSKWENTMIGDGGWSGFDVADPSFRFHSFYDTSPEVNFNKGEIGDWIWISDPIFGTGGQFYSPIISDPKVAKTMFAGTSNAWRTKTHGLGTMTMAEAQQHCNTWTGDFAVVCGDWAEIATPSLNDATRGDRSGGSVVAIERTIADTKTAWAATQKGRLFVSTNVDAEPASAVTWDRIDTAATPNRFVTSIYVDRANGNRAWISYSGYGSAHVLEATYNPATHAAVFVDRSYDIGDLPVTDLVRDDVTGDLYAASDFGVVRLAAGSTTWTEAAPGMPNVEVAGLTIVPSERILYAASHGLGAWRLNLG